MSSILWKLYIISAFAIKLKKYVQRNRLYFIKISRFHIMKSALKKEVGEVIGITFLILLYASPEENIPYEPNIFSRIVRNVSLMLSEVTISYALSGRFVMILSTPIAIIC